MKKTIALILGVMLYIPLIAQEQGCSCLKFETSYSERVNFNDSLEIKIRIRNFCNKDVLIYRDNFYYDIYDSARSETVKMKTIYERMYRTEVEPILIKPDSQVYLEIKYYSPKYHYDILTSQYYTLVIGYFKAAVKMKALRKGFKNFYLYNCSKLISEKKVLSI